MTFSDWHEEPIGWHQGGPHRMRTEDTIALSIKNAEADRLARAVAAETGETLTQAVVNALRERLAKERRKHHDIDGLVGDVMDIGRHYTAQPLLDRRTADEIIGYTNT